MARCPYRASGASLGEQDRAGSLGHAGRPRPRSPPRRRAGCAGPARPARPRPGCPAARRRRPAPCPRAGRPRPPGPAWPRSAPGSHRLPPRPNLLGQRVDGAVGPVGVHAEGEERPGGRAFRQPVPGPAASDQLRAGDAVIGGLPGGQARWCRRRGSASGSRAGRRRRPGRARLR